MPRDITPIVIQENGDETHESWIVIRANNVSSGPPGHALFDSEIRHQHYIIMEVSRCIRKRDLKRDWLHATELLLSVAMSQAQWGAFVSSFGNGTGVPATLEWLTGQGYVSAAPYEPRLAESHREVKEAATEALAEIQEALEAFESAFDNEGKRAQREKLRDLHYKIKNGAPNMVFAAKSLTEHVEKVVTKARADIEGMVAMAEAARQLEPGSSDIVISLPKSEGD